MALELPRRTTEIVRVTPTDEQLQLHGAQMQVVQIITRKAFLTEMDLLRLQKALLLARMSANSIATQWYLQCRCLMQSECQSEFALP